MEVMKEIEVVAAVICSGDKIFVTQRGYGEFKDWWEFPGGKIEVGESTLDALHREILEELNTKITVRDFIQTIEIDYPNFHLIMHCYLCEVTKGNLTLLEHEAARWIKLSEWNTIQWLPADDAIYERVKELIG